MKAFAWSPILQQVHPWIRPGLSMESPRDALLLEYVISSKASCKNQDTIKLTVYGKPSEAYTAFEQLIAKMTKAESIDWVDHEVDGQESFVEKWSYLLCGYRKNH